MNEYSDDKKKAELENFTVTSTLLEKMLVVGDRRIRQLADEGIVVRVSKGKYDLVNSIKNYVRYLKLTNDAEKSDDIKKMDYDLEHAKNERVKRMQNELKLQLMKGEVHKAAQVEIVLSDMLVAFRNRIMLIPEKLTPILIDQDKPAFIRRTLEKEVCEALDELKEYNPSDYYDDSYVDYFRDGEEYGQEDAAED